MTYYLVGGPCDGVAYPESNASAREYGKPVVVIDPENKDQVERLAALLARSSGTWGECAQAALRDFDPPKPVKPEEPLNPGAVVKDADGVRWVSWRERGLDDHSKPWERLEMDTDEYRDYAKIAVVAVLFEGDPAE